jgi:RimJ/RimL family protein N-acetyltransferase
VRPVLLLSERLTIRDLRPDDWTAVHRYASDPEVTSYLRWGPSSEDETRAYVAGAIRHAAERPRTAFELGIVWRATDGLIGGCGLLRARHEREWEIGYCLQTGWWHYGVGTETVRALVGFAFETLDAHRLFAFVDPENTRSANLLERVGFRREGHLRCDTLRGTEWRDSLLYALLADDGVR